MTKIINYAQRGKESAGRRKNRKNFNTDIIFCGRRSDICNTECFFCPIFIVRSPIRGASGGH